MELPAGRYTLGEPGEEREVELGRVLIGRYPVVNAHLAATTPKRADPQLADHPATDVTLAEAEAFCASVQARLPTADEWEALARGRDARAYPWGDTFDETCCNCAEALMGWTVPVTAHPHGASPVRRRAARRQRLGVGLRPHARRLGDRQGRLVPRHRLGAAGGAQPDRRPRPRHPHHRLPHRHRPGEECMTDRSTLIDALREVYDPCCADRGISIVDMGVVEDVRCDGSHVAVDLVLTSGWCPFVASMSSTIPEALKDVEGVETVDVQVVWDPVWTMDRLSPSAREKLEMPLEELEPYRVKRSAV